MHNAEEEITMGEHWQKTPYLYTAAASATPQPAGTWKFPAPFRSQEKGWCQSQRWGQDSGEHIQTQKHAWQVSVPSLFHFKMETIPVALGPYTSPVNPLCLTVCSHSGLETHAAGAWGCYSKWFSKTPSTNQCTFLSPQPFFVETPQSPARAAPFYSHALLYTTVTCYWVVMKWCQVSAWVVSGQRIWSIQKRGDTFI